MEGAGVSGLELVASEALEPKVDDNKCVLYLNGKGVLTFSLLFLSFPFHICPKGNMEGEHCAWKGVCWCGWNSYLVCAIGQNLDFPALVGRVRCFFFPPEVWSSLRDQSLPASDPYLFRTQLPHGQWCMVASQVTVRLKSACAGVRLASLPGLGHVLCRVAKGDQNMRTLITVTDRLGTSYDLG